MPPKSKPESGSGSDAPPLNPDTMDYELWRKMARLWAMIVKIPKKDKGVKIFLKLQGRAQQAVKLMDETLLYSDEGFNEIIKILDGIFLPDKFDKSFYVFDQFIWYRKTPEISMRNFLADFQHYYNTYASVCGPLDDTVLAWMVLSFSSLDKTEIQLVKAGMGNLFTFENTKNTLKRLFVDEAKEKITEPQNPSGVFYNNENQQGETPNSQTENEVFYSSRGRSQFRGRSRGRNQFRGPRGYRGSRFSRRDEPYHKREDSYPRRDFPRRNDTRPGYSSYKLEEYKNKMMNPISSQTGENRTCNFCNSKFHYKNQCGEFDKFLSETGIKSEKKEDNAYSYLVVLMSKTEEKQQDLVNASDGRAVLDTGCPHTVCGEPWLAKYIEKLSDDDCKSIEIEESEQSFTFGDGNNIKSNRKMKIPVWIGGKRGTLSTDVVDTNIPLLLSVSVIEKSDMILHLSASKAYIKDKTIKLKKLMSGHYALPLSL